MKNIAIYYRSKEDKETSDVISLIENFIDKHKNHLFIKGVFIDGVNERTEFLNLLNNDLQELDTIFINDIIDDEFDWAFLNELSRNENFNIRFLKE